MNYQMGDSINTKVGILFYQCSIPFKTNTNPKYDKLGGRTLYWFHNDKGEDVLYWDRELKEIYISDNRVTNEDSVSDEECV